MFSFAICNVFFEVFCCLTCTAHPLPFECFFFVWNNCIIIIWFYPSACRNVCLPLICVVFFMFYYFDILLVFVVQPLLSLRILIFEPFFLCWCMTFNSNPASRASLCLSSAPGEIDDGDYATLRGPTGDLLHFSGISLPCDMADDTSEEGKLLESVRDDSVTYASTRDLEPPLPAPPEPIIEPYEEMISPLAPVMVTVHSNEAHVSSSTSITWWDHH